MTTSVSAVLHSLQECRRDEERRAAGRTAGEVRRRRLAAWLTLALSLAVLAWSLRIPAGDPLFYPATVALAAVLVAGALVSRCVAPRTRQAPHEALSAARSSSPPRGGVARHVVLGVSSGLALLGIFLLGAGVVSQVPTLRGPVDALLEHARLGSLPVVVAITVLNGVAEEFFYRGSLYDAHLDRRPLTISTVAYAAVAAASGVPLLALAALVLGAACALLRRRTGALAAPIVCHLVWSVGMLLLLPPALHLMERSL